MILGNKNWRLHDLPKQMMVHAFDGTKMSACIEVDLKILIGPCKFEVFL